MNRRCATLVVGSGALVVAIAGLAMFRSDWAPQGDRRDDRPMLPDPPQDRLSPEAKQRIGRGIASADGSEVSESMRRALSVMTEEFVGTLLLSNDPGEYVEWRERQSSVVVSKAQFARFYDMEPLFASFVGADAIPPTDMREAFMALRKGALAHGNGANMPAGLDAAQPVTVRFRLASLAEPAYPGGSEGKPMLAGRRWFVPRVTLADLITRDTHVPVVTITLPVRHVDDSLVRYHIFMFFDARASQWVLDGVGVSEFDEGTTSGLDY